MSDLARVGENVLVCVLQGLRWTDLLGVGARVCRQWHRIVHDDIVCAVNSERDDHRTSTTKIAHHLRCGSPRDLIMHFRYGCARWTMYTLMGAFLALRNVIVADGGMVRTLHVDLMGIQDTECTLDNRCVFEVLGALLRRRTVREVRVHLPWACVPVFSAEKGAFNAFLSTILAHPRRLLDVFLDLSAADPAVRTALLETAWGGAMAGDVALGSHDPDTNRAIVQTMTGQRRVPPLKRLQLRLEDCSLLCPTGVFAMLDALQRIRNASSAPEEMVTERRRPPDIRARG